MVLSMVEKKKKPKFNVQNYGFNKKVKQRWRRPRGVANKKRKRLNKAGASPTVGYKNKVSIRYLHPKGLKEVLVSNLKQLDGLKNVLVRISSAVGAKKRVLFMKKAAELKLTVLNPKKGTPGAKPEFKPAEKKK